MLPEDGRADVRSLSWPDPSWRTVCIKDQITTLRISQFLFRRRR